MTLERLLLDLHQVRAGRFILPERACRLPRGWTMDTWGPQRARLLPTICGYTRVQPPPDLRGRRG